MVIRMRTPATPLRAARGQQLARNGYWLFPLIGMFFIAAALLEFRSELPRWSDHTDPPDSAIFESNCVSAEAATRYDDGKQVFGAVVELHEAENALPGQGEVSLQGDELVSSEEGREGSARRQRLRERIATRRETRPENFWDRGIVRPILAAPVRWLRNCFCRRCR